MKNSNIEWTDHTRRMVNSLTGKPGPAPMPARDGDKQQARQRINVEVRTGYRAHPNDLACVDCSHVHVQGERRHEYDHYLGYAAEHHGSVQSVCTTCHAARDNAKAKQTQCKNGHEFTPENTYRPPSGGRSCRACMKEHESQRGPRGSDYWKQVNAKRRDQNYGKNNCN